MEFFDALVGYEVRLWNAIDAALRRRDQVGLGTLHALRVVAHYDGHARVQDLSSDIGITVGAASKLVDRLERDELVRRSPNPDNRRSSLVTLTSTGRKSLRSASRVCRGALAAALGNDEEIGSMTAGLQRLQARLAATDPRVAA